MSDISIIIPTYQHADTIGLCLDSVLAQTLPPKEIIVVNDGSTDQTQEVLQPYLDAGLITVQKKENQGNPNPTRNMGFHLSSGSRVLFLDADIVMRKDMLENLSRALDEHPNVGYAYSAFRFGWKRFRSFSFDADRLKRMNYIHTSALIRREVFPGFDETIKRFQDWDLWLTMLEKGIEGVLVPEVLFQALQARGRMGISSWRPSFFYKVPWFGHRPDSVKKYEEARKIIYDKHHLWT